MAYEQLKAGAAKFQLYFKLNNALVPTTVVEDNGRLVVQVIAPDNNIDVYYIDRFAGQQTNIALYTENNSAADYNLYDVTLDETVHGIRGFRCDLDDDFSYVIIEIDGKLYMPYNSGDNAQTLINWNDSTFEYSGNIEMNGFIAMLPKLPVEFINDDTTIKVPSFDEIQLDSDEITEMTTRREAFENKVDGLIFTEYGTVLCLNGKYKLLSEDGVHSAIITVPSNAAFVGTDNEENYMDIYDSRMQTISEEGVQIVKTVELATAKQNIEGEYGITIEDEFFPIIDDVADSLPAVWPFDSE